ncbi:MAG: hypothetical protein K8S13_09540 [Desulfobacula sp.]|uniref:hypothetical protein n=1 Tax=Desulfobacula sp. TaxID=2593537 RepID=UPI0025C2391D|nr:hypothetical protein [Desulfobacula sp.]MCD4720086.1 hypothetical protein [Desulfobacula sp.]
MISKVVSGYKKYVYWLTESQFHDTCNMLSKTEREVALVPRLPGLALKPGLPVAGVPPAAWNGTCNRQGSWYRQSEKKNMFLLVSNFQLLDSEIRLQAVITESNFYPPRLASKQEKMALVADSAFKKRLPEEWSQISSPEKRIYLKWAKRLGSNLDEFNTLFLSQTANHSNFMRPLLYTEDDNGAQIPYSIDCSAHLCSCCVELFDIVGARHPKKLVAPCPGAVICTGLEPNRYLMVESYDDGLSNSMLLIK